MASKTQTNRIDTVLASKAPGLWPFIAVGDPDLATTEELLQRLGDTPIRGVELGFPFSDPVADGPVIQAAFTRALSRGVRVAGIFDMVARIRGRVEYPILAMVSASIVYRFGAESFVARGAQAGFDGLIVPDLSLEEAPALAEQVRANGLRMAMLIAPTTPEDRQRRIAQVAGGFLYYVSIQGVTGQRESLAKGLRTHVCELKAATGLPVLVGFGISRAEHVREVCGFADGAIVGSAIVQQVAALQRTDPSKLEGVMEFIRALAG